MNRSFDFLKIKSVMIGIFLPAINAQVKAACFARGLWSILSKYLSGTSSKT